MTGTLPHAPLRVLVVDDCHDTTDSLAALLRMWGDYKVDVAHNGPGALEEAQIHPPDIVLLDIKLGIGMDGYDVARRLRSQRGSKDALLVCITGYGTDSDIRRSKAVGFDLHLTKPFNPEELQRLLAGWKPNLPERAKTLPQRSAPRRELVPSAHAPRLH
jgi:CheY-like chemotaxis protein